MTRLRLRSDAGQTQLLRGEGPAEPQNPLGSVQLLTQVAMSVVPARLK